MEAWGYYVTQGGSGPAFVPEGLQHAVDIAGMQGFSVASMALVALPPGVAAPELIGPSALVAYAGQPFHHRISAKNGVTSFAATGLPAGVSLDSTSGIISGIVEETGTYAAMLYATNHAGGDERRLIIYVNPYEPPALRLAITRSGDQTILDLQGPPSRLVEIQTGSDLDYWVPLATLTNRTGMMTFTNMQATDPLRFFRGELLP